MHDFEVGSAQDEDGANDRVGLRQKIIRQGARDYELWSIVTVTLFFSSFSLTALVFPSVLWGLDVVELRGRYLPQLTFGLASLIVLLNLYVIGQRRTLRRTHEALVEQLTRADDAVGRSLVDPLTGVFNRRYLDHLLEYEARRTDRTGAEFSLLMVDVNDFSTINNRLGHVEGDRYLQQIAQVLQTVFRESDAVTRYGGDEFVVFMPSTAEDGAATALQRLRAETASWNASNAASDYEMSISCGVATYGPKGNVQEVLDLADRRMYQDKACRRASGTPA